MSSIFADSAKSSVERNISAGFVYIGVSLHDAIALLYNFHNMVDYMRGK